MNAKKKAAEKPSMRGEPSREELAADELGSPGAKKSSGAEQAREKSVAKTPVVRAGDANPEISGTRDSGKPPNNSPKAPGTGAEAKVSLPDRKEVVQLATQLVSAQITAHSYHETTMNLFTEFRQLALDAVYTLKRNPTNLCDLDSMAGEIAGQMSERWQSQLRSRKPRALQPMSHPDLDRLFQSAMRRAFVMLNAPFDPERIVFAEQIFSHSELLTEGAIRRRFIDFKWPSMKSADPVIKLMQDVNRWFTKHLKDLNAAHQSIEGKEAISALDPSIPIGTRIEAEADKLSWLLQQTFRSDSSAPETFASYRALESALSEFNHTRNGLDIGGAFRSMNAVNCNNLIFIMFDGNGPRNVDATTIENGQDGVSDDANTEGSLSRSRYRPWAIFRYLRRHGREAGDELGRDLYDRLRARRSDLDEAIVPNIPGIEPAGFEFGPLHQEAEDLLDELKSEGGSSGCATDSDELELHGFDPEDIAGAATEFGFNDQQSDDGISKF